MNPSHATPLTPLQLGIGIFGICAWLALLVASLVGLKRADSPPRESRWALVVAVTGIPLAPLAGAIALVIAAMAFADHLGEAETANPALDGVAKRAAQSVLALCLWQLVFPVGFLALRLAMSPSLSHH